MIPTALPGTFKTVATAFFGSKSLLHGKMFGGPKDGEVHDVPFEFFLKDFLADPDLDIEEHGAISMNPSIFVKGTFKNAPFLLRIYLTPQTVEVYETFNTYTGKAIVREPSHED